MRLTAKTHRHTIAPAIAKTKFYSELVNEILRADGFAELGLADQVEALPRILKQAAQAAKHTQARVTEVTPTQYDACEYCVSAVWFALLHGDVANLRAIIDKSPRWHLTCTVVVEQPSRFAKHVQEA